jgi:hypothetical protein
LFLSNLYSPVFPVLPFILSSISKSPLRAKSLYVIFIYTNIYETSFFVKAIKEQCFSSKGRVRSGILNKRVAREVTGSREQAGRVP